MTEKITRPYDGGAAFPQPGEEWDSGDKVSRSHDQPGMSLRDYFAAKAMSGQITAHENSNSTWSTHEDLAAWSYQVADAMLKERSKP